MNSRSSITAIGGLISGEHYICITVAIQITLVQGKAIAIAATPTGIGK